jgi:hypothetical protein
MMDRLISQKMMDRLISQNMRRIDVRRVFSFCVGRGIGRGI